MSTQAPRSGKPLARRPQWRLALGATALALVTGVLAVLPGIPDFVTVRSSARSSEAQLLDRHGVLLQRLRLDRRQRHTEWVPLNEVSPAFVASLIAAEDKRFRYHAGVDPLALMSALWDNLRRPRARGASTLTMQLAGLLMSEREGAPLARGFAYKLAQMRLALGLELRWSKREILEAYVNRVGFRGELVGLDAAARGLVGKGASGLDHPESAVLVSLIRAPTASRARVAQRACRLLQRLDHADDCSRAAFVATGLPRHSLPMPGADEAPHLARRLLARAGEQYRSSLDAELQRFAAETLRSHLAALVERNVEDGAVVVLDNASGEVLAYVGSSGDLSGAPEVDGAAAQRQPGSTLKPFLYASAIEARWLTAASVLDDSSLALTTPSGLYIPQDYDRHFKGPVTVRTALGASLNVPAVRGLTIVGVDRFLRTLRELGMNTLTHDAEHYGFGLALGGAETSLLTLTNAYRSFAREGRWTPVRYSPDAAADAIGSATEPESTREVFSPQTAFILSDVLSDPAARAITFGLSSPLSARTWAAVKTGTSKGMRDNWAVGYTDRYTVGVWVGNFSGAPMWDVSGITGAAPVWRDIVEYLHRDSSSRAPTPPEGVVGETLAFDPPIEAPRREWFIAGTQPEGHGATQRIAIQLAAPTPRLLAPPDSAIVAPDPDIPHARQSIRVEVAAAKGTCVRLDGKPIGSCGRPAQLLSLPAPGEHKLELVDTAGRTLDAHMLTVRGLYVPARANGPAAAPRAKPG
ncbi:penicillin-binding protein 1C [Niveibacterium sp. SC-1]|uniref:penicillin-binding protein 1C n=1 Tax=Niveibacterium sp. SC-1 TaxID=3135646 RepID=UPI00311F62C7